MSVVNRVMRRDRQSVATRMQGRVPLRAGYWVTRARGFATNTQDIDVIKVFYSLSHQVVLDAISEVWPDHEANAQFAAYYVPASVCVYPHKDC